MAKRKTTKRRTTRRRRGGFIATGLLSTTAGVVGGGFLTDQILSRVPIPALQTPGGQIAGRIGASLLAYWAVKKIARNKALATAVAAGGLASVAIPIVQKMTGGGTVAGWSNSTAMIPDGSGGYIEVMSPAALGNLSDAAIDAEVAAELAGFQNVYGY